MIGSTIAHYSILEKLGEGGMGVVYKALDTKLDRPVALKFLPAGLHPSDQDRARFLQEARAAAALNHPNVCSVLDIAEHDGRMFIVMEFVDGQTLRARLPSLGLKQALDIGIQIAEGLAAAHEKGIVHRDIKPENIMVRKDGIAQIMDFGLAKLRTAGEALTRLTKQGSTVGTAGYMSPEQVQGQDADHRSDIFSLGVLLYEMLAGQLPFKGVHETAMAYEIVNVDPAPMSTVKPELDPELDRIVLECLQKDPDERYNAAKDLAKDLKRFKRESSRARVSRITAARPAMSEAGGARTTQEGAKAPGVPAGIPRRELAAWSLAVLLLAFSTFLWLRAPGPDAHGVRVVRSSILVPDSIYVHSFGAGCGPPVISPDGRAVAFTGVTPDGTQRIYVRRLTDNEVRPIPGTEGGQQPFWSPDGKSVGYFDGVRMRKVDLLGGSPFSIADVSNARGASWSADGTIVFTPDFQAAIHRVSADGTGRPEPVTRLDSTRHEGSHRWPVFLPDGKHFLYLARAASETGEAEGDAIFAGSVDGSVKKLLVQSSYGASYAEGRLLFARDGVLMAQELDPEALELSGEPVKLQEGLLTDLSYNIAVFTASGNGTLVYATGRAEAGARPMFVDRSGTVVRYIEDRSEQDHPRFSPDGTQLALYLYDTRSRRSNIWVYDLRTSGRRRLTTRGTGDFFPVWSPDGERIFFTSGFNKRDVYVQGTSHAGGGQLFLDLGDQERTLDCSPDGKTLLVQTDTPGEGRGDLWLVNTTGEPRKPVPFQKTKFDEHDGRISRDGRWVAYVSDESGANEVYVKPLSSPESDGWKVSSGGGNLPSWGPGSDEVVYVNARGDVTGTKLKFTPGGVEPAGTSILFPSPPFALAFDVSPDGRTFVITRSLEMQEFPPLSIVTAWKDLLNP